MPQEHRELPLGSAQKVIKRRAKPALPPLDIRRARLLLISDLNPNHPNHSRLHLTKNNDMLLNIEGAVVFAYELCYS
jgi:serine/threonine protein kinase